MARYAIADLHGQLELWNQIKNYCKLDDTIYFLGDAIDRGPCGIQIMRELLNDRRVIYLRGNHEEMMLEALKNDKLAWDLWSLNNSVDTNLDFNNLPEREQIDLLNTIERMPYFQTIINNDKKILLCHAGTSDLYKYTDLLWDRQHLTENWMGDENIVCVHGHTPVAALKCVTRGILQPKAIYEPYIYANGHKIDIDLGSSDTHMAALFNLDTLQTEQIFKEG